MNNNSKNNIHAEGCLVTKDDIEKCDFLKNDLEENADNGYKNFIEKIYNFSGEKAMENNTIINFIKVQGSKIYNTPRKKRLGDTWSNTGHYYISREYLKYIPDNVVFDIVYKNVLYTRATYQKETDTFKFYGDVEDSKGYQIEEIVQSKDIQIFGIRKDMLGKKARSTIFWSLPNYKAATEKTVCNKNLPKETLDNILYILNKDIKDKEKFNFVKVTNLASITSIKRFIKRDARIAYFTRHYSTGTYYGNFAYVWEDTYVFLDKDIQQCIKDICCIFDTNAEINIRLCKERNYITKIDIR